MENNKVILTVKELKGMEMYKKTPAERAELKKIKAEYKAMKAKQNGTAKT
jgi:hypothetical protein